MITQRTIKQITAVAVVIALALLFIANWRIAIPTALLVFAVFNSAIAAMEIGWRGYSDRSGHSLDQIGFPAPTQGDDGLTKITAIVPALREEGVMYATLKGLSQQNYPTDSFQVIVALHSHDAATIAEAERAVGGLSNFHIMKDEVYPKGSNKSTQMNRALKLATGELIAVFDAEDKVAPGLFRAVDAKYKQTDADVIQGAVQLFDPYVPDLSQSWLTRAWTVSTQWWRHLNVQEYRFWFRSRMFYQADLDFVPLGGNTVFITRTMLDAVGGWDESRLTEDAALGVKLSAVHRAKVVVAYTAEHVTHEQTPPFLFGDGSLFTQRVRWDQGFWQVLRDREWLRLPTLKQRFMAGYILATPLIQAGNGLVLPIAALTFLFLKTSVTVSLLLYVPLMMLLMTMVIQLMEQRSFEREFKLKPRFVTYVSLVIGYPVYQFILAMAAVYAVFREARGNNTWVKTARTATVLHTNTASLATQN